MMEPEDLQALIEKVDGVQEELMEVLKVFGENLKAFKADLLHQAQNDGKPTGGRENTPNNRRWRFILNFVQEYPEEIVPLEAMGMSWAIKEGKPFENGNNLLSTTLTTAVRNGWLLRPHTGQYKMSQRLIELRKEKRGNVIAEDLTDVERADIDPTL